MITVLRIVSTLQLALSAFLIAHGYRSVYASEGLYPFLMVLAAGAALVISFHSSSPRWILFAGAGANILAILAYCVPPFVVGGEAEEGFFLMLYTGLFLVVIGPPAINAILLLRIPTERLHRK